MVTPESIGLQIALTLAALLFGALGALLLYRGAREDAHEPALDMTDARVRIGDGASVLRFRLDPTAGLAAYDPAQAGLDADLRGALGLCQPFIDRPDPLMQMPVALSEEEFRQLLALLSNGLLDPKARPENLRRLIPARLPSVRPVHNFRP